MERGLFRGVLKIGAVLVIFAAVTACSPQYNWRTVQSPEQRYTALFPGKPDKLERLIPYQDQELKQSLEAVKVNDDIYSISSIQVTANQPDLTQKIVDQFQGNLLNQVKDSGGIVLMEDAFYQTSKKQQLPTKDYFITYGSMGNPQQIMRVRWIVRSVEGAGVWIYQLSVLHKKTDAENAKAFLSAEQYANFFNEFRPE